MGTGLSVAEPVLQPRVSRSTVLPSSCHAALPGEPFPLAQGPASFKTYFSAPRPSVTGKQCSVTVPVVARSGAKFSRTNVVEVA